VKKIGVIVLILLASLFFINNALAVLDSVDSEIKKVTYQAQEYETGNINYPKLLIYISEAREGLNGILGATEKNLGGVVKQEEIERILGEPTEETRWVWVEGENHDKRLDSSVPVWKKIIFDGEKIQITLEAFPSIFTKTKFSDSENNNFVSEFKEGDLIYRLNFWIEFKQPQEQIDIKGKIGEIQTLAETFNSDPSESNARILAQESVSAEKTFQSYFRQNPGKCENLMSSVFGSESQRPNQNIIVQEVDFYSGEDFDIIARLEMCDDCEWYWINLDLRTETRGPMKKMDSGGEKISPEQYKDREVDYYKSEITNLLNSYKIAAESGNWDETNILTQKLWAINDAWNQKSNDVWKEVDEMYKTQETSMTEEERRTFSENYGWIKQEQEKRKKVNEIMQIKYEERKQFYQSLFSDYSKKEYSFTQIEFRKRLIELFKERGEEICNNNVDDNQNELIDCNDNQCGGKICGRGISTIVEGNQTREGEVDFYCIAAQCQAKEEIINVKEIVCGNHVCEENETIETCSEDCALCPTYSAVNCSGKVIFSGTDENGCSLEPTCIEEQSCSVNEDCKFLCGEGECIEGICKVKELTECKETECTEGTQKSMNCVGGESITSGICLNGLWASTELSCSIERNEIEVEEEIVEEDVIGDQCTTRFDCGGENDVCSNGQCVTIPEKTEVVKDHVEIGDEEQGPVEEGDEGIEGPVDIGQPGEENIDEPVEAGEGANTEGPSETESGQTEAPTEESSSEPPSEGVTGGIIFSFFRGLFSQIGITGKVITGFVGEEGTSGGSGETGGGQGVIVNTEGNAGGGEGGDIPPGDEGGASGGEGENVIINNFDGQDNNYKEREDNREDDERRDQENEQRCNQECKRPCVEKCIRENCGDKMECSVEEEQSKCENSCTAEESCITRCKQGGDWWQEVFGAGEEENKQEKGGFEAGGSCRTAKGKTEGFIWFGGWGDPFEQLQQVKQEYYSTGDTDWCKAELQNLIKQREEFEKGFNQEFARWFFEEYLANSAENWEQSVSGIYELYWKNVDNQREIAFRMKCADKNDIGDIMTYNLINFEYETEFGSIEYWEEAKEVNMPELDGSVTIISPYMKIWVFPSKEFIKYEMKTAMKNHEFPGSSESNMERKNEEGLSAKEKEQIMQDSGFMEKIRAISQKYNGNLDAVIQFKEGEEVLFNLYAQVNEQDIFKLEPMLPEEVPAQDVKVEIEFQQIYELIYEQEKEMNGQRTESPPWDKKIQPIQGVKNMVNEVKSYFKIRSIMNSAKFTPEESSGDMKKLFKEFFSMAMSGDGNNGQQDGEKDGTEEDAGVSEEEVWEGKEVLTGQIILV
jgi:hypothetical protein